MRAIKLGSISIAVEFKNARNLRLTVYPPEGRVRLVAPPDAAWESVEQFVRSKARWIQNARAKCRRVSGPPADAARNQANRRALRETAPALARKWEPVIGVRVNKIYYHTMKTRWGSCNCARGTIRLNTRLAQMPPECLEYVIVHEMLHIIERSHNRAFYRMMDRCIPGWKAIRKRMRSGEN